MSQRVKIVIQNSLFNYIVSTLMTYKTSLMNIAHLCVYISSRRRLLKVLYAFTTFSSSTPLNFFIIFPQPFTFRHPRRGSFSHCHSKRNRKIKKVLNTKHNQKLSNCCENSTILQTSFQFISESGRYAVVAGLILLCFNIQLKSNITQILSKPTHPSKTLK